MSTSNAALLSGDAPPKPTDLISPGRATLVAFATVVCLFVTVAATVGVFYFAISDDDAKNALGIAALVCAGLALYFALTGIFFYRRRAVSETACVEKLLQSPLCTLRFEEDDWEDFARAEYGPRGRARGANAKAALVHTFLGAPLAAGLLVLGFYSKGGRYGTREALGSYGWTKIYLIALAVFGLLATLTGLIRHIKLVRLFRRSSHIPKVAVIGADAVLFNRKLITWDAPQRFLGEVQRSQISGRTTLTFHICNSKNTRVVYKFEVVVPRSCDPPALEEILRDIQTANPECRLTESE